MKLHLNKDEFGSYLRNLVSESINNISADDTQSRISDRIVPLDDNEMNINEQRTYVRSLVAETLKHIPSYLMEGFYESMMEKKDDDDSDAEEYFSGKDVHGKTVKKSELAYTKMAVNMLQDPIIDRDALADEIDGLSDLAEGSARSYLSKVASGERPIPTDMAKAICQRIHAIGKQKED